jgi:hypothetical protein
MDLEELLFAQSGRLYLIAGSGKQPLDARSACCKLRLTSCSWLPFLLYELLMHKLVGMWRGEVSSYGKSCPYRGISALSSADGPVSLVACIAV